MNDDELFDEPFAPEQELTPEAVPQVASSPSTTQASAPLAAEPQQSYDDLAPARRSTYVRQRAPRRTQEAIDDLAEDDNPVEYAHESNVAVGGMIADRRYRSARSDITKFQKNNRYGQYLEIPKGRRSIFAKRERSRRRSAAVAAIVVIGLLAIAAYVVWQVMNSISLP